MERYQTNYTNQLIQEIKATPGEDLPTLLSIVRSFRYSITLKAADKSFERGWKEAMDGEAMPIEELWTGIGEDG